ncbi:RlpA-like double-psi beta-barrel domain-containing protein [Streptomyces sp. MNU76]|uniref:RlpA-like double-psi beta-barrel domain-containing protein n=1 Tax=Streptomyces sp. MNU76 TaxID=2560026 RepID=UPI001E40032E|nr:RlpA-like double-psi beta-barrel domain-containing protein [Streptomyces sp. MNU76]MCC9711901.1 RlpA-like double-psi beta-barrel domain-containing protein [Streptomyces sp. MNU76]
MAVRSSRSARRPRRRTTVISAAVAAVGLAASLVIAFGPGRDTGTEAAGKAGATPVTDTTRTSAPPTGTPERKKPSPTPSKSPSPSASKTTPAATPTTEPTRPTTAATGRSGSASGQLAGRIRPGVDYTGVATFYDAGNGDGACSFGASGDVMTAAMNTTDYEVSKACGAYVRVRAGGAAVTVRITNECPSPCRPGQLDLSAEAFAKLAAPSRGEIPITWSLLSPAISDPLSIRYKTGSSQYWCGIQVLGHRNPVARLEVRSGGAWTPLPRTGYNYFLSEQGGGCGGALRITDIYGERLTVEGLTVRPDVVQRTSVQFTAR